PPKPAPPRSSATLEIRSSTFALKASFVSGVEFRISFFKVRQCKIRPYIFLALSSSSFQLLTFDFQLLSPPLPCKIFPKRGYPIAHVRQLAPRRACLIRPTPRPPPPRFRASSRFRHPLRAHPLPRPPPH